MRCRGENCDKYELDCAKDNNDCMHTYIEYSNCVDSSTECTSLQGKYKIQRKINFFEFLKFFENVEKIKIHLNISNIDTDAYGDCWAKCKKENTGKFENLRKM